MKILLHCCCGPCATFPFLVLRSEGHEVDLVFFNPNIYPEQEVEKRWAALSQFAGMFGSPVLRLDCAHKNWKAAVSGDHSRCRACYSFRLARVASMARENGYDCFTTSLLVSPYQDHEGIREALERSSAQAGVPAMYRDFRCGYKRSRELARGMHMYMQKYCGCEFSIGGDQHGAGLQ